MPYAPTVVMAPSGSPVPHAQITFTTVDPAAITATVYRNTGGRVYRVRRGIDVAAAGGFSLIDDEAPFIGTMTYNAEMFNATGAPIGYTDPSPAVSLNYSGTIIHNPVDSSRNAKVTILDGTADRLMRPYRGDFAHPILRHNPVWIGRGRGGLTGIPLALMTTGVETDALRAVFGEYEDTQGAVVCYRSSVDTGLPGTLFLVVPEPEYRHLVNDPDKATVWAMVGTETSPPVESIGYAPLSYGDLEASFTTYSTLEAYKGTYRGLESAYELIGVV